jgi:hypothetical protein
MRSMQNTQTLNILTMDSQLTKLHPCFASTKSSQIIFVVSWASTCTLSHAHDLVLVLGFNVYPVQRPWPCPRPFPEPGPTRPEFCPCLANLVWVILDHARSQLKINAGRRGTNQLRLVERYLDILVKHTTEIPPPTALVEGTAPSALVEGVSLRWVILSCGYLISLNQIHAHTCYQLHVGNESPILENLPEISWNPSPISRFLPPKIQFSSHEIQFSPISFLLSSTTFRFLQRLSDFPQRLSNFPQWLSSFQEIQENLFTGACIQKITIRALYFSALAPQAS